jgi:FAD/FMN-containing dehydrogenase
VLDRISASRRASFLAVLKSFGPANDNYLSFPMEGYTLALDFKIEPGLFDLLDTLDEVVLEAGGRLYLTKDVRMSAETFRRSYPRWPEMEALRRQYGADQVFNSRQSQRLEL